MFAVVQMQECTHKVPKSAHKRFVAYRTQFTIHPTRRTPHSASLLVQVRSGSSVKTRQVPSWLYRDASAYGYIWSPDGLRSHTCMTMGLPTIQPRALSRVFSVWALDVERDRKHSLTPPSTLIAYEQKLKHSSTAQIVCALTMLAHVGCLMFLEILVRGTLYRPPKRILMKKQKVFATHQTLSMTTQTVKTVNFAFITLICRLK